MSNSKQAVAFGSILASLFMTLTKLAAGLFTGSLGILAEAAHSALDLGATVLTWLAVRVSDKPADREHPYGHGKVESVAALAETALLFLTSAWIVVEAVQRLRAPHGEVDFSAWGIAVIVLAIVIDFYRARALTRVARETRSQALEADALHFSSDILSSGVVLLGLGFVYFGYPKADALAAIGVALFVCVAGYRLGRRTVGTLIDTAPEGVGDRIHELAEAVPGVVKVRRVRARPAGSALFVDLGVAVSRLQPLDAVAAIKEGIRERVRREFPEAELTVYTHPVALDDETVFDRVGAVAATRGLPVHHVTVQRLGERICVSVDVEVDGALPLADAHGIATGLENAIREELGRDVEVETHIEPRLEETAGQDVDESEQQRIGALVEAAARRHPALLDVHDLRARRSPAGLFVTFHCTCAPDATVHYVHRVVSDLEAEVRGELPDAVRVVVHAEPSRPRRSNSAA